MNNIVSDDDYTKVFRFLQSKNSEEILQIFAKYYGVNFIVDFYNVLVYHKLINIEIIKNVEESESKISVICNYMYSMINIVLLDNIIHYFGEKYIRDYSFIKTFVSHIN